MVVLVSGAPVEKFESSKFAALACQFPIFTALRCGDTFRRAIAGHAIVTWLPRLASNEDTTTG